MKTMLFAFVALLLAGCSTTDCSTTNPPNLPFPNAGKQALTIYHHATVELDNACADTILADASNVLQSSDSGGDVACPVRLVRRGNVTRFSDGDGSIDSQSEFNRIMKLPGNVKVVDEINWCGEIKPNILGCAPIGGNSLAVVRYTPRLEGILWAHEYGHDKGRNHRNGDHALMHERVNTGSRRVNQAECNAFRK